MEASAGLTCVRVLHVHGLPYVGLQGLHEVCGSQLWPADPWDGVRGLEGCRGLVVPRSVSTHSRPGPGVVDSSGVSGLHLVRGPRGTGRRAGAGRGRGVGGGGGGGEAAHRGAEVGVGVGEVRGQAQVGGVASVGVGGVVAGVGRDTLARQVGDQPRQVPGDSTLTTTLQSEKIITVSTVRRVGQIMTQET